MKIALFGATGMVGRRIAAEAVHRGHHVVAASRSGKAPLTDGLLTAVAADAGAQEQVAEVVRDADVVASALVPLRDGTDPREPFLSLYRAFLTGIRGGGGPRVVVVGGAGSLTVDGGTPLMDTPGFPADYKPEALAHAGLLAALRDVDDLTWTSVSPAAMIAPGERTGLFRVGGDTLLTDRDGNSAISAEDYAVAFVNELEQGSHPHARISVAY
ncbi:epimerase [Streptomyces sp. CB00455]|uniref:NAD(P)-dependent oxidoreductase n=1 Tax=Streptomyces sp. CB00455 TaxID=1703927 RepID=UPI00093FAB1C|nr:NAD(P)H-binding protein [Streptomyces sp. CB00455]OKK16018.1 epimerase [Streptomyces sp. CB00455]